MLQMLMYTVTAIVLYVLSDRILVWLERRRGKPFAARSIVFFIIIMVLSVSVFEGIQYFFADVLPNGDGVVETGQSEPMGGPMPTEPVRSPALPPLDVAE